MGWSPATDAKHRVVGQLILAGAGPSMGVKITPSAERPRLRAIQSRPACGCDFPDRRLRPAWPECQRKRTHRPRTCHNDKIMARPAKVTTTFPSVLETAKRLGVSKRDAMVLSAMAERSQKTGVFVLPGIGRLVRVDRKTRMGRSPATGEAIKIPGKKVVKVRGAKAAKDALVPPQK